MASIQTVPSARLAVIVPISTATPKPQPIAQYELEEVILLHNMLREHEAKLETIETDLKARLEAGAEVERGVHVCELKTNSRRNVPWKEVAMRLAEKLEYDPDAYCANILAHTKPTKSISLEVR